MTAIDPISSLTHRQRMRIHAVMMDRCEGCLEPESPQALRMYPIPGEGSNPEKKFLFLCSRCKTCADSASLDHEILHAWLERRPFRKRLLLRRILGYHPSPYLPPDVYDLEELYRSACSGWCLNGSG